MSEIASLVGDHLDIWTAAVERKNGAGRGGGKRTSLYGIERLRGLILDLAVRGKLVAQYQIEGTGTALLEEIEAERARQFARGDAKRTSLPSPLEDWPFQLPDSWQWTQLGIVTNYGETEKADPGTVDDDTWVLELEDVEKGTSRLLERVAHSARRFQSQKNRFRAGDVIYGKLRPYLDKVLIAVEPGVCTTEMVPMRPYHGIEAAYLRLFLKSPFFISLADSSTHGMNLPRLGTDKARAAPFALPPLAEQRRIVEKVGELMALCDALEEESAAALTARQTLVETLLATLVGSADAAELADNWSRLAAHFDTLFTTPASVDTLKRIILELAVRGTLVTNEALVTMGTLNDVGEWVGGSGFPKQFQGKQQGDVAFLKVSDMNLPGNERLVTVSNNWVSDAELREMRARAHPPGTIIFPKIGGAIATNKRRILTMRAAIDNNCAGQIPLPNVDADWLYMVLCSVDMAIYQAGTSVPAINMRRLGEHPVAIPDPAAQRAVVRKVDALLALCDALKAGIADAEQTQMRLADTIVEIALA